MKFNFLTRINKFQQKKLHATCKKLKTRNKNLSLQKKIATNFVFLPPLKFVFIVFLAIVVSFDASFSQKKLQAQVCSKKVGVTFELNPS